MPFQNQVNQQLAPAVAGDFASKNPRATVDAGPGGLVAGSEGVTVGKFAWVAADGVTVHNYATSNSKPAGFVHREQQALITTYLAEASSVVPGGFPITLMSAGDFFAKNAGVSAMSPQSQIYASFLDGSINTAAPIGASVTATIGSSNTAAIGATFTATGSGTNLTVSAVTGVISLGDQISGTGVTAGTTIVSQTSGMAGGAGVYVTSAATTASASTVTSYGSVLVVSATTSTGLISIGDTVSGGTGFPVGATVVSQISGTAGGIGSYRLSASATQYVASATGVTTFGNVLNVTTVGSGTLALGDALSGTGVPANTTIATQVSGATGGVGVYTLSIPATGYAASTTVTVTAGIATSWYAKSTAAVGELVKISTWGN